MTPARAVTDVVRVEAVLALLTIALLFVSALRWRRHDRRRAAIRTTVHRMVARRLTNEPMAAEDVAILRATPRSDVVRALTDFAATIGGGDRAALVDVATLVGLPERAASEIHSALWRRRLRAARLLTLLGGDAQQIQALMGDDHPLVRAQGASAAAAWPFPDAARLLVTMLADVYEECRFAARDALTRLGQQAIDALWTAVSVDSLRDRDDATALLELAAAMPAPHMVDAALRYTEHPRDETRVAAAKLLTALGGESCAARLTALLDDPSPLVRATAARGLGSLAVWRSAPALGARLDDDVHSVRVAAAAALQRLGPPGTLVLRRASSRGSERASAVARHSLEIVDHVMAGDAR